MSELAMSSLSSDSDSDIDEDDDYNDESEFEPEDLPDPEEPKQAYFLVYELAQLPPVIRVKNPFLTQRPEIPEPEDKPICEFHCHPPSVSFMTTMFVVINVTLSILGFSLMFVGMWAIVDNTALGKILLNVEDTRQLVGIDQGPSLKFGMVLVCTGFLMAFVGVFGVLGCVQSHARCIDLYIRVMILLIAIQVLGLLMMGVFFDQVLLKFMKDIQKNMTKTYDGQVNSTQLSSILFDLYMTYVGCCGPLGWKDFVNTPWYTEVNKLRNSELEFGTTTPSANESILLPADPFLNGVLVFGVDFHEMNTPRPAADPDWSFIKKEKDRWEKEIEPFQITEFHTRTATTTVPTVKMTTPVTTDDLNTTTTAATTTTTPSAKSDLAKFKYDREDYNLICSNLAPPQGLWRFPQSCCETVLDDPDKWDSKLALKDTDCLCKAAELDNRYSGTNCYKATKNLVWKKIFIVVGLVVTILSMELSAVSNAMELVEMVRKEEKHVIMKEAKRRQQEELQEELPADATMPFMVDSSSAITRDPRREASAGTMV